MRSCTSGAISASIRGTSAVLARRTENAAAGSDVTVPPYKLCSAQLGDPGRDVSVATFWISRTVLEIQNAAQQRASPGGWRPGHDDEGRRLRRTTAPSCEVMNRLLGLGRPDLLGQCLGLVAARLTAGREDELAEAVRRCDVVHVDVVAGRQLAVQDLLAQRVLDLVLHRAAQRTGPEGRVPAEFDQTRLGRVRDLDGHVAVEQALRQPSDEESDHLQQLVLAELREDDRLVDAV